MSTDHTVYLGPFLRCKFAIETTHHPESERACPRGHLVNSEVRFCPECGVRISWKAVEAHAQVDSFILSEQIDHRLSTIPCECSGDVHVWAPNAKPMGCRRLSHDPTESTVTQFISAEMVDDEIELFQSTYALDIEHLREAYLECEIRWGLLIFYW